MDVNGTMGKNKFKHHPGPLRSRLLAGALAPGSFGGTWYVLNNSGNPVTRGPATAGPGVTGRLSELTRTGGSAQAAYDGHPLYTYVGDSAPGQANGNGINLNGGLWHEVPVSGSITG